MLKFSKKKYSKLIDEGVKFSNNSVYANKEITYIYNKKNFYCFEFNTNELSNFKPLLFNPEPIHNSFLLVFNGYLYIIGKMKFYDDCVIFKTSLEALSPKFNSNKEISYEVIFSNFRCC